MTLSDPVVRTYAIATALMVLKYAGHGWLTVITMLRENGGFLNPEDAKRTIANLKPRPGQLDVNERVERTRRMHRNETELTPAFFAMGWLFVLTEPPLVWAQILLFGYVASRWLHGLAYITAQNHEVRAALFSVSSLCVIAMAGFCLYRVFA